MNLSLAHSLYRYTRVKFNNALIRVLFRNKQPQKKYFLAVCAIFKNGEFAGLSTDGSFKIDIDPAVDELTIRTANSMGGLGKEAHVDGTATTGINTVKATADGDNVIYNLQGIRVNNAGKGIFIINGKKVIK